MKNSPHHRKHLAHKAIRAACQIQLTPSKSTTVIKSSLTPTNVDRCRIALKSYIKNLEHAKHTNPYEIHQKNPNKIRANFRSSDIEKSRNIARKMLKQSRNEYKKAA